MCVSVLLFIKAATNRGTVRTLYSDQDLLALQDSCRNIKRTLSNGVGSVGGIAVWLQSALPSLRFESGIALNFRGLSLSALDPAREANDHWHRHDSGTG